MSNGNSLPALEAGIFEGAIKHPAFMDHPSKLFVEVTTRCNLSCRMCMKQSSGSGIREGDMSKKTFNALVPALSKCESLVLNGIGEPLLHPHLLEFVRTAKNEMPPGSWVGFQTNGLLLNEAKAFSLVEAGLDKICLSVDAICPDMFRKIREGGEVSELKNAFAALKAAKASHPESGLSVGIEFVVMRDNLKLFPEVIRWSALQGAEYVIASHLLPYELGNVSQAAYDSNTDRAIELYHSWKKRAEAENIDLSRYFFINFYKFFRTPEEQRVVDFVKEMVADARSRNVFFHLRNLIARDEELSDEVNRSFERAKEVAKEVGIDLRLPGVSPKMERRCSFIEEGSALISWDGAIHPCYFLWHSYICHFPYWRKYVPGLDPSFGSGADMHSTYWQKNVNSKSFGNIAQRNLVDIWNDPEFVSFRAEALSNEYPYCSNCNLVPCEHIASEEFERDCFLTTVPCGDCFWSMGLFNCLM